MIPRPPSSDLWQPETCKRNAGRPVLAALDNGPGVGHGVIKNKKWGLRSGSHFARQEPVEHVFPDACRRVVNGRDNRPARALRCKSRLP